ncbi:hypothetical protein ACWCPQ_17930 [Nocardia sp. NPDC001965]
MTSDVYARLGDPGELRARLRHIYWIGGGSGARKSAVAARIAARHDLRVYSTDATMADHARRSTPGDAPRLSEFMSMSMDERWVNRTPEQMLETFHWFRGECFGAIIDDLLGISDRTVAEGFRLLPELVAPLLADSTRAIWLLPGPAFRRTVFADRGWEIACRTGDPARARRNLLRRDEMFTDRVRARAHDLSLPILEVDGSLTIGETTDRIGRAFGL